MAFKLMPSSISLSFQERKFTLSALATALAVTGFSPYALAQKNATDTLHVTATPLNTEMIAVAEQVDVIDAQAPEQQSATSALDLLKGQPGVFVSGSGSTYGQSIQMRGYDSRGVKITVDNVTQDFNSGLYNATFIDPNLIKKVYVHKGSASVNHGGGALAGVVSFKTLNAADLLAADQNLGGHLFSGINRNDHSYYAGATLLARTKSFDTLLSYSQRKKQLVGASESNNLDNHEKIHNWMLKTTWFTHPTYSLAIQLREYRNDSISLKQPRVFDTGQPKFKNTPHERYSHQQDFLLSQHFSPSNNLNWQADWDIYSTNLHLSQLDLVKATSTKKADRDYDTEKRNQYTYGTKFSNNFTIPMNDWVNHHIQSGFEYYQQAQKPNQHSISYPPAELSNTSGWLTNDITLHHFPITFSAGTRFTRYQTSRKNMAKDEHTNWSSRFAVSATPTHWLNVYSSYSEGYRTPRMSELYNNSNHFSVMGGLIKSDFRPSPDLQPETNKTIEAGMKLSFDDLALTGDSLQFGTTYFNTKAKNYIAIHGKYISTHRGWFPSQIYYINIPSASIHGIDSFINYKTHWFNLNISHNQTVGEEDGTHYSLSSVRPETLLVRMNVPITATGINVGWVGEFAAKTKFEGNSTYQLPKDSSEKGLDRYHKEVVQYAGYSLHDFYVNYQADQFVKGLSSTLTMRNAFDKQYISSMGVPQEGRNFYFNVNYKW